jgi:hypothetical protein
MSSELLFYVTKYSYGAIFVLVLLQELGVPNPVTNEFVLLFSGYLAFSGVLNFWLVFWDGRIRGLHRNNYTLRRVLLVRTIHPGPSATVVPVGAD